MKKIYLIILVIFIGFISWAGIFYLNNLRGSGPAFTKPLGNIADIIENTNTDNNEPSVNKPGENLTDMPLKLPDNFSIGIFAKGLVNPRAMRYDPAGRLLVSITSQGTIVALPDENSDIVADKTITVLEGLNKPHGIAFDCEGSAGVRKCKLFIAEENKITSYDYDESSAQASNPKVITNINKGGRHFTRTIDFGPDGRLYASIGSSCDVCYEKNPQRGAIYSMNKDGSDFKEYARGLRNSVFFTWHPETKKMWATEMGRDQLGDNLPPDEINIIEEGKNYGWPECYGKNILDEKFHKDDHEHIRAHCKEPFEMPSYIDIPAHSAPLGISFFPKPARLNLPSPKNSGTDLPQEYTHDILVALHGSWNRTTAVGYKIVRYDLDEQGKYLSEKDFVTGWLGDGKAYGRPADILILQGGLILVSDDKAGVIYKIIYNK